MCRLDAADRAGIPGALGGRVVGDEVSVTLHPRRVRLAYQTRIPQGGHATGRVDDEVAVRLERCVCARVTRSSAVPKNVVARPIDDEIAISLHDGSVPPVWRTKVLVAAQSLARCEPVRAEVAGCAGGIGTRAPGCLSGRVVQHEVVVVLYLKAGWGAARSNVPERGSATGRIDNEVAIGLKYRVRTRVANRPSIPERVVA